MPETQPLRINTPLVAFQEIEGEAILINFDSGCYYSANATGAFLLDRLQRGATPEQLGRELAARWALADAEARESVERFLGQAREEGLVVSLDASAEPPSEAPAVRPGASGDPGRFVAPLLEKFEDLQDLLMLDPIHDVDQAGWPMPAPPPDR